MLKQIKIQGYKSLVELEVSLEPLAVLFGPNASGKSNFLDALQLLSRIATNRSFNPAPTSCRRTGTYNTQIDIARFIPILHSKKRKLNGFGKLDV